MERVRLFILVVLIAVGVIFAGILLQKQAATPVEPPVAELPAPEMPAPPPEVAPPTPLPEGAPGPADPAPAEVAELPGEDAETVMARLVTAYGVVIDGATDAPVAGAKVRLALEAEAEEPVVTDGDGAYEGTFVVPERPGGSELLCEAQGYRTAGKPLELGPMPVVEPSPEGGDLVVSGTGELYTERLRLDFVLRTGSAITGTVTDARTGAPIAGVSISSTPAGGSFMERAMSMGAGIPVGTTDDAGEYRVEGLEAAAFRLLADGSEVGYIVDASATKSVSIPEDGGEAKADFQLTLGGTVRGTVRTADGGAPEEARVRVMGAGGFSDLTGGVLSGDPSAMMRMRPMNGTYDSTGAYTAKGLAYDRDYRVTVKAADYAGASSETFRVTASRPEAVVNLTLAKGSTVSGTASYEDGSPATSRDILLFPDINQVMQGNIAGADDDMEQSTGNDGGFTFANVPAGKYTVMAQPSAGNSFEMVFGGEEYRVPVEVDGVNDVTGVKLVLKRPEAPKAADGADGEGTIRGTVLAPDGRPAENVTVSAEGQAVGFDPTAMMARPRSAVTDAEGAFTLDNLDKETYDLTVKSALGNAEESGVAVGDTVTLRLQPPTRLAGHVLDQARNPVPNCAVTLKSEGGGGFDIMALMGMSTGGGEGVETDDYGFFEFDNALPGGYTIAAKSRTAGTGATEPFTVEPGRDLLDLEVILTPGVAFSGRVTDGGGAAVEGATVMLQPAAEGFAAAMSQFLPAGMREQAGSAETDATGAYEILRVPPGLYTVNAAHPSYSQTNVKDVLVEAGKDVRNFDIVLTPGGCVDGVTVLGGQVRAGIMVQVMGEGGMHMGTSDGEGKFEICNIPPGTYLVQAVDAASAMTGDLSNLQFRQLSIEVFDGQTTTVDFAPPQNTATISGVIRGELGTMTQVMLRRPGGPAPEDIDPMDMQAQMAAAGYLAGNAMADADGAFVMEGVEEGDYLLEVLSMSINPLDIQGAMEMDRTPQIRQEIRVEAGKDQDLSLTLP